MKHGIIERGLSPLSALIGIAVLVTACGGSDEASGAGAAGAGGCADCRTPPEPPDQGAQASDKAVVFAFSRLYLGDRLKDGTKDPNAWKQFGYDLDGINSTQQTAAHCQPLEDATDASIKSDGEGGIDNSFGANVLPILEGIEPDISGSINAKIGEGKYSMLLEVEGLGDEPDYLELPAALYFGAKLGSQPAWDGSDTWPVYCELMQDCQLSGTKQIADGNESIVQFPSSYVVGGTWVSGSQTTASISLTVQGLPLRVEIGQAVMTVELDEASPTTGGSNGVIAGIIDTTNLIGTLAQLSGRLSTSLCEGSTLEQLKRNLKAASDIRKDGSQDPAAGCNGISVGMGFEIKHAQLGEVQDALEPEPDPCEDL